jgi:3-oxoacid CoA-transferase B subunit
VSDDPRLRIAERAALELAPGEVVNLGIGIPNLIPRYLAAGANVFVHTENGLLGVGPPPSDEELDEDLIDAAKRPVTALPGAAYFDSAQSFAMIRGGHIDVAVLGALQVSEEGDIANWAVPGRDVLGVGGAMDLVVGARRVIVTMTSRSSSGEPKVVDRCTYPLTAPGVVDTIVTELAVFRRTGGQLRLVELLDGATVEDVAAATTARFAVDVAPAVGSV